MTSLLIALSLCVAWGVWTRRPAPPPRNRRKELTLVAVPRDGAFIVEYQER
jgi:hypothetical protein